ncbi:MAG: cysteine desulfurase family protein [Eubacterium sp.]|nr:cysteine desulfurase family protein [Eubacterium sp.]
MQVYLDNSATTAVCKEAADKAYALMIEGYGNPSSLHSLGHVAEKELKDARSKIMNGFGSDRNSQLVFTSCGTESDNMAIIGTYNRLRRKADEIITTKVEHPAVLEACKYLERQGAKVKYLDVDSKCMINPEQLREAVNENTALISIMTVNNETGSIMPIEDIAKLKGNAVFHTDSVQAFGKLLMKNLGADLISISAHKINGPKGVGALYARNSDFLSPIIYGGGQEKGYRSGTENLPGIAAFGVAADMAYKNIDKKNDKLSQIWTYLREGIRSEIKDVKFNTTEAACKSILNVSFLGTRAEVILHKLEQYGIMVSTGSACSSGKKGGSHVLKAMGLSRKEIESAVRFSFSAENTIQEMDYVLSKLKEAIDGFRRMGSFR